MSSTIELTPSRWSRVETLFEQASLLEGDERDEWLAEECADDPELRDYVASLLVEDEDIAENIAQAIVNTASDAFSETDSLEGEHIGPYRVERLIGAGGMGMVYLARRADEQFDQQVAIKLGKHRLIDPQTEDRLRNERQILADLDHPNIARLFDGGTTDDGVPYLVMEYIDGVRIDNFCDARRLGVRERLDLFQTICAAVHYAHQNLVIHRDIKASNILVTADGVPKLLDFGIAKLTDTQGAATDGLTREGSVIMTPQNAAPEQVLGRTITTATDTYALGLLLYNMLTGLRAFPLDDLTPAEIARVICEMDPVRPSLRLAQALAGRDDDNARTIELLGRDRGTSTERLRRRLRGDLDTIVMNALRKEPERRYGSVEALSADITLHRRSMPIEARADSWRYRTGKFLRRHYVGAAVSAAIVVLLVGVAVVLSIQNQRITEQRDRAQEVSRFLEVVFTAPDPSRANGETITARELLDAGALRIQAGLGNSPDIQAELMGTIGRVYFSLGVYEPSVEMLEAALETQLRNHRPGHPLVASAQNDLARSLIRRGDYDRARQLLNKALATFEARDSAAAELADIHHNFAQLTLQTGELQAAEDYAETSIGIFRSLGTDYRADLATLNATLARILQVRGDLDRTESLLREAISLVADDGNDAALAYYQQNLAVLLRSKGDFAGAETALAETISTARRVYGDEHDLVAAALMDKGTLLHMRGSYDEAEQLMREALRLNINNRGPDHTFVAIDRILIGMLLHDQLKLVEAEAMLREALAVFEASPDPDNQYTASALTELGAVLSTNGRLDDALGLLDRALAIRERDYQPGNALLAATQTEYADVLTQLGRYGDAERLLEQSVAVLGDASGRRSQRADAAWQRLQRARGTNQR